MFFLVKAARNSLIFLFCILYSPTFSQDVLSDLTIDVDLKGLTVVEALKKLGKAGDIKFSYDKSFFEGRPRIENNYFNVSFTTVLKDIIGKEYHFERFGDGYIAIYNVKQRQRESEEVRRKKEKEAIRKSLEKLIQIKKRALTDEEINRHIQNNITIRDSIKIIEKEIYDTLRVVTVDSISILDTTVVQREIFTLTRKFRSFKEKGLFLMPYGSIGLNTKSFSTSPDEESVQATGQITKGIGLKIGYESNWFFFATGIAFVNSNLQYNATVPTSGETIVYDTLDTYIQIVNGEEIPFFVIDSSTVTNNGENELIARNNLSLLELPLEIGLTKTYRRLKVSIAGSIIASYPIEGSTHFVKENTFVEAKANNFFISWQAGLSLDYGLTNRYALNISPFFRDSLGDTIYNNESGAKGGFGNYGITLGVKFYL